MRLLVVEDESRTSEYLQQGLSEAGFVVDLARNGLDGRHLAVTGDCDPLILSVILPDLEGWQTLHTLRSTELTVPALFLAAHDSVTDRVKGLELGADDCMVKPFAFTELFTRVRALFRRDNTPSLTKRIQVIDLVLDLTRRRASRGDQRITLISKEFSLLELLARRHGEVLPRSLIASQVWNMNFDSGTNVIGVTIRHLRVKIDDNFEPRSIRTIRGIGYVLEGPENGEQ